MRAQVTLAEGREASFAFTGEAADVLGVSILQCTGEKPQELFVELSSSDGTTVDNLAPRPGCIMVREV